MYYFFFQAEDGIRDYKVTGVQTCALPIWCRLDNGDGAGQWCVAPVRQQPPAPPPDGVERRSRERMTLELAGLCVGLLDHPPPTTPPRRAEPGPPPRLARQPPGLPHRVANPLTGALGGAA